MKTTWTQGLNADQSLETKQDFIASKNTRDRLRQMLEKKVDSSRTYKVDKERYQDPSWAFHQADSCGYERALREVISLLS